MPMPIKLSEKKIHLIFATKKLLFFFFVLLNSIFVMKCTIGIESRLAYAAGKLKWKCLCFRVFFSRFLHLFRLFAIAPRILALFPLFLLFHTVIIFREVFFSPSFFDFVHRRLGSEISIASNEGKKNPKKHFMNIMSIPHCGVLIHSIYYYWQYNNSAIRKKNTHTDIIFSLFLKWKEKKRNCCLLFTLAKHAIMTMIIISGAPSILS